MEGSPSGRAPLAVRLTALMALAGVAVGVLSAPASAGSAWDPQDTGGPLDIRWLGAYLVDDNHTLRLTISFYGDFSTSALPTLVKSGEMSSSGRGLVYFDVIDYFDAFLARRRDGAVVLAQPYRTSEVLRVRVVWPDVLRVWIPAFTVGELDIESTTYAVRAFSEWRSHGRSHRDRSAAVHLPSAVGGAPFQ